MPEMRPRLVLVGSVAEGTRLWLANELDLMLRFESQRSTFRVAWDDPYHLYMCEKARLPRFLQTYLNSDRQLLVAKFMRHLLGTVDEAVCGIFDGGQNPPSLERLTWHPSSCLKCGPALRQAKQKKRIFKHCEHCSPNVTQTKVGICLQFQWRSPGYEPVYCSIDIVPTYSVVEPIDSMSLARLVNLAMLQKVQPSGWFNYLKSYAKSDLVLEDVCDSKNRSVFLKLLNSDSDVYYVRPGQIFGPKKFSSSWHAYAYRTLKLLKKSLGLPDLDMYMVKKLLLQPTIRLMHLESVFLDEFSMEVMRLPELLRQFSKRKHRTCNSIDNMAAFWSRMQARKPMPGLAPMADKSGDFVDTTD